MKTASTICLSAITLTMCLAFVSSLFGCSKNKALDKSDLYGYWSLEGVTWLKITADSIYYVDEPEQPGVKYSFKNDTITWLFDEATVEDKVRINKDTLFINTGRSETKFVRVR